MVKVNKLITVLMFAGASIVAMEEQPNINDQLIEAVQIGHFGLTKRLLNEGADPVETHALFYAAVSRDREMCKLLISEGASLSDLNHFGGAGQSPLMIAAVDNDLDMIKFLIENGADVGAPRPDSQWTVLMDSALKEPVIKTLLTTIPLVERQRILAKRGEIQSRINTAELSMKQSGAVAQKDIRKMIGRIVLDLEIDALVDEQLARIIAVMRMRDANGKTAHDVAQGRSPSKHLVDLLDPENPETIAWLRSELAQNIRQILFSRPVVPERPHSNLEEQTNEEEDPFGGF